MLRLVRDEETKIEPSKFEEPSPLAFVFSLISAKMTINYFAVHLRNSNNVAVTLSAFVHRPILVELNFYNHKGATYVSLNQRQIRHCTSIHSYNLHRVLTKEWIPNLQLPQVAISVAAPGGQLCSTAFTQLEFTNVSIGTYRILIKARTTSVDCCRTLLIMVDLLYHVPQLYCYDAGDQEGHSALN
jgi:hypothetical protein